MRLLSWRKDGGPKSNVTGFFIIEIKCLFSIVLLRVKGGAAERNFHTHAFNAWTMLLMGWATEFVRKPDDFDCIYG